MLDKDIRPILAEYIRGRQPDARIIPELGLHGGFVIADVVAVGFDEMIGYEIKSDSDCLKRLPRQMVSYDSTFDRCALVGARRHIKRAREFLPAWWGLIEAREENGVPTLEVIRDLGFNPSRPVIPRVSLRLMWNAELRSALEANGWAKGVRGASGTVMTNRLLERMRPCELRALVRHTLRVRQWDNRDIPA